MKLRRNKKGLFFILDIVFGLIILVVGLTLLITFYYQLPQSNQFSLYSSDAMVFFSSTKVDEINSNVTQRLISSNVLYEDEFLGESLARLCYLDDLTTYETLIGAIVGNLIPTSFNYLSRISYLNGSVCLETYNGDLSSYNSSSLASSSQILVFGVNGSYSPIGPYIFEVRVW